MAQPSVASYFNTRKRTAIEDLKISRARKLLHNDNSAGNEAQNDAEPAKPKATASLADAVALSAKLAHLKGLQNEVKAKKKAARVAKPKKVTEDQQSIQDLLSSMIHKERDDVEEPKETTLPENDAIDAPIGHKTPPATPTKSNAMDKVKVPIAEMSIKEVRQKLMRSSRLAELKAAMSRFKEKDAQLQETLKEKPKLSESPGLKSFKSIELEVHMSPAKSQTPEKQYLSPRKDSTAKRNLLNLLSPTKNAVATPKTENRFMVLEKLALTLPYRYRTLAELFRSIDTVSQIMHNRKETITFKKLKPAVEELIKRNLTEKHLAQIMHLYPDAFDFRQEKLRAYGTKTETWELIVEPRTERDSMTADVLLERRRKLFKLLIDTVKVYHQEFLAALEPPMVIDAEQITRWHPEFDIERVPDIACGALPRPPPEERFATGQDVLERARIMFNCNTRMEAALARLQKAGASHDHRANGPIVQTPVKPPDDTLLKGIPKSLLERVRQKQAAKALESMTRTDEKEKEVKLYANLSELARLTRNLFVSEKRSVLLVDVIVEKLGHSMRTFMKREDIETRLRLIEKEVPGWLMFHNIRQQNYVKIAKDADLSRVQSKLDNLLKLKLAA